MSGLSASLESLVSVIRVHGPGGRYGDPYTWAATVRWIDHDTAEIIGVVKCPSPAEWRAVQECLELAGVRELRFVRIHDGRKQVHTVFARGIRQDFANLDEKKKKQLRAALLLAIARQTRWERQLGKTDDSQWLIIWKQWLDQLPVLQFVSKDGPTSLVVDDSG